MPYSNPMAQDLRHRAVRDGDGPGARARRLEGLRRARRRIAQARGRLRGRGMATFLEWTGADVFNERVTVTVSEGRRQGRDRDLLGDAGHGAGARSPPTRSSPSTCSACRSSEIRIVQGDTDRGTGLRQRRLALAVRRRLGGARRRRTHRRRGAASSPRTSSRRRSATSSIATACSASRGTDRRIGLFDLARRQPGKRIVARLDQLGRRRDLAQRLPHLRGRDRSRHRRGRASTATGRSTTSAASSIR